MHTLGKTLLVASILPFGITMMLHLAGVAGNAAIPLLVGVSTVTLAGLAFLGQLWVAYVTIGVFVALALFVAAGVAIAGFQAPARGGLGNEIVYWLGCVFILGVGVPLVIYQQVIVPVRNARTKAAHSAS
jgi:hypothetical protein